MTFEEERLNEIEKALKFLGSGEGYYLAVEDSHDGYGQLSIKDAWLHTIAYCSLRNVSFTGALLIAYGRVKDKAVKEGQE